MNVAVFGSTSSIGTKLCEELKLEIGVSLFTENDLHYDWRFGMSVDLSNIDSIILLSHDRSMEENLHLFHIRELLSSFKGSLIFLSSMSAKRDSSSKYGRTKFGIEEYILEQNGVVIRSGIVWDRIQFGIFKKLNKIAKLPIILCPSNSKTLFRLTNLDDLVQCIKHHTFYPRTGVYFAISQQDYTLIELLKVISNSKSLILPINHRTSRAIIYFIKRFFSANFAESLSIIFDGQNEIIDCHECHFREFSLIS